ncbi:hypothetical protein [Myxacorys almedinensis]|uniref:DUF2281 domain-containing protein n=1 Tax=Myxacorys almedinensis A TaxID=2690445 RepID=A0A8J8CKK2_9CYAN|nr:hypothetical protein [Myxacorys almedinensis]NDJ19983.1 hypothetical protein [Myxacorys almedinensis A]
MSAKEQLLQEIEQAPDFLIDELLDFLLFAKMRRLQEPPALKGDRPETPGKGLLRLLEKFPLTEAESALLPTDLAAQHDHYLYGLPKRD